MKQNRDKAQLRRRMEALATVGLLLVAVGLVVPFAAIESEVVSLVCRCVYSLGAVLFTVARGINVNSPSDSLRLRRMRRMEMWGGFCFVVGAAFWWYNAARFAGIAFSLPVMNNTIVFTLAGAVIQIVASMLISARAKKEQAEEK